LSKSIRDRAVVRSRKKRRQRRGAGQRLAEIARAARRRARLLTNNQLFVALLGAVVGAIVSAVLTLELSDDERPRPGPTEIARIGTIEPVVGTRILKREPTIKSYVLIDGVAHSIPDGATYMCSAIYYPVEFDVSASTWNKRVRSEGEQIGCPTGEQPPLGPKLLGDRYLLIEPENEHQEKRVWLVVDGRIVPVPTSDDTFDCLARRYLVWDFVGADVLRKFPRHPTINRARCGGTRTP
jgi:hypothetical protein